MTSSEDFQKVFELYQKTGVPKRISIVSFCQQHGIVYSHFERWYKSHSKGSVDITQVRIVDRVGQSIIPSEPSASASTDPASGQKSSRLRFNLSIRTNEVLSVQQNNLTYPQLLMLVKRLEVIC